MHMTRLIALITTFAGLFASGAFGLELARDAETSYVIVQASDATEAEQYAATELAHFLQRMTGASFDIVKEADTTADQAAIHIGQTALARELGIESAALGPETWVLRTHADDLLLTGGRPRGTLYAVYEFLETYGGCRWIAHDIDSIPEHPVFTVPAIDVQGQPAFDLRETTLYPRHDLGPDSGTHESYARFLVRNRYNGSPRWLNKARFGYLPQWGSPGPNHTLHYYRNQWSDDVPVEFYAMKPDGTRATEPATALSYDFCQSAPGVRDLIYDSLVGYITQDRAKAAEENRPPPRYYALSQNDTSTRYCYCETCTSLAESEGSYSAVHIRFVNDIADRIALDYPDIRLVTEAYQYTKWAPKTVRPRPNVIVRLPLLDLEYRASEVADVLRPITSSTNSETRNIIDGWLAVVSGEQLFMWDYAQFRLPFRYPFDRNQKIMTNLAYWHELGIRHAFIEKVGVDIPFRQLSDWLFMRKSLKPELDNDQLVEEYLAGYYGPAAPAMRKYYDRLVAITIAGDVPYVDMPPASNPSLTPEFYTSINGWLDEAEALALRSGNIRYLRNVKYERVPVDSGILHLWHRYATDANWSDKKELVLWRYEQNKQLLIDSWNTSVDAWVKSGQTAFPSELAMLRMEPPAQFLNRNAATRLMAFPMPGMSRAPKIEDPDAAGGKAAALGNGRPQDFEHPLRSRIHDEKALEDWGPITIDDIPQDEAYHWYHIGTAPLTASCLLWFNVYTVIPLGWAAVPPPNNEREIWVSLKFTGPSYVAGSTQPDQILIDQVVAVPQER